MKIGARSSVSALLFCSSLVMSAGASADHDHFHNIAPAAGHAAHDTGHAPPGPHGSGYWHGIPPAAPHGAYFAAGGPGHYVHYWGHGDIRYFHDRDFYAWHGGYWHHSWYGGRFGWWWVVSGVWFFYPVPVYPYPDPYVPSTVIVQQAPPPVPTAAPAPAYWYYCASAQNYYPYVTQCPVGWEQVPATPATIAAPEQAAPPPPQGSMPPAPPPPQGTMPPAPPAPPTDDNTW